jgi:hypothetical protein
MIRVQRYHPVSQELGAWETINETQITRIAEAGNGHVRILFVGDKDDGTLWPEYVVTADLELLIRGQPLRQVSMDAVARAVRATMPDA